MSHARSLVVELAKLAGGLAAEVVHRGLNALVPSPAERRAGVLAVLEPTVCNGHSPADIRAMMESSEALEPNQLSDALWAAENLPATGSSESVADWVGFYDCPCGGAYEMFEDSTPENLEYLKRWFDDHRGCGKTEAVAPSGGEPRGTGASGGPSGRTSDGHSAPPVASYAQPSTRTPHDEIAEPVGEYPDVDPHAVITGGRRDWSGVGVPPSDQKLPPELRVRANPVPPKSSAGHSPLSADTAPSPSEPAPQLVGSGPLTPNELPSKILRDAAAALLSRAAELEKAGE